MREQRTLRVKDDKTIIVETLYEGDRLIDDATEDAWIIPDNRQTIPNTSILGLIRLGLLDQGVGVGTGSGPRGQKGDRGEKGDAGADGINGNDGQDGNIGNEGIPGNNGADGINGLNGADGIQGLTGPPGHDGVDGAQGNKGGKGDPGKPGNDGRVVATIRLPPVASAIERLSLSSSFTPADANTSALQIDTGEFWLWDGYNWVDLGQVLGEKGDDGARGPQGDDGVKGDRGEKGNNGVDGFIGPEGPEGPEGDAGNDGDDGADSVVPGPQGDPGDKGEKGDKGDDGDQGVEGQKGDPGQNGTDGADLTGPELKVLYEAEADTNAFTDIDKSKLDAIDEDVDAIGSVPVFPSNFTELKLNEFIPSASTTVTDLHGGQEYPINFVLDPTEDWQGAAGAVWIRNEGNPSGKLLTSTGHVSMLMIKAWIESETVIHIKESDATLHNWMVTKVEKNKPIVHGIPVVHSEIDIFAEKEWVEKIISHIFKGENTPDPVLGNEGDIYKQYPSSHSVPMKGGTSQNRYRLRGFNFFRDSATNTGISGIYVYPEDKEVEIIYESNKEMIHGMTLTINGADVPLILKSETALSILVGYTAISDALMQGITKTTTYAFTGEGVSGKAKEFIKTGQTEWVPYDPYGRPIVLQHIAGNLPTLDECKTALSSLTYFHWNIDHDFYIKDDNAEGTLYMIKYRSNGDNDETGTNYQFWAEKLSLIK